LKVGVDRLQQCQEDQELLSWLNAADYASDLSDTLNRRQEGTGQWFLDSPKYQAWLQCSRKTLLCPGIAGAGKTVLTSVVINHLQSQFRDDERVGIAYIFCKFQKQHEQKTKDILKSLMKQLAQGRSAMPPDLALLYAKHKSNNTRPSFCDITTTLRSLAASYSKVFIVIDALDECQSSNSERAKLLSEMEILRSQCGANIFATSRPIPEVVNRFSECSSLEISAPKEDIETFLAEHMKRLSSFDEWSQKLQDEIMTVISDAVSGM
jgi:hypothetical protein